MGYPRVAVITHDLSLCGGAQHMAAFVYQALAHSGRYTPEIISLSTDSRDRASVQIRRPSTWTRGVQVLSETWRGIPYRHVGAWWTELEPFRYRARQALTDVLAPFDILHFVLGSPPWLCAAPDSDRPVLLYTATLNRPDRETRIRQEPPLRQALARTMLRLVEDYEERALRTSRLVFALSQYTYDAIQPRVGAERTVLAPTGVDVDLYRPGPASGQGDYILCVARFSDGRKNVRMLFRAYADLRRRVRSVPDLYLVGAPPMPEAVEFLRSLGIEDHVRMLGPKGPAELAELYRNARFFTLSSDEEGLGIVIQEAMASGLPVVSTASGGPETLVVDGITGYLTPVGDAAAFTDAMDRLLSNPELCRSFGAASRRRTEELFSIEAASRTFLDRYDAL